MSHGFEKIRRLVQRKLAEVLAEARDPRLGFFTLMSVKLSPDLRHAQVFISVAEEEQEELTLRTLREHRGHFRSELAKRLQLKRTPELDFRLDETEKRARSLEEAFRRIERELETQATDKTAQGEGKT